MNTLIEVRHRHTPTTRMFPNWLAHSVLREPYQRDQGSIARQHGKLFGLPDQLIELYNRLLAELFADTSVQSVGIFQDESTFYVTVQYDKIMNRREMRRAKQQLRTIVQNFANPKLF